MKVLELSHVKKVPVIFVNMVIIEEEQVEIIFVKAVIRLLELGISFFMCLLHTW